MDILGYIDNTGVKTVDILFADDVFDRTGDYLPFMFDVKDADCLKQIIDFLQK